MPLHEEQEVLLDFKQYAFTHDINHNFFIEKEKLLVDMQHYGVPTRLLDWTVAPLHALFFACKENAETDGQVIVFDPWTYWINLIKEGMAATIKRKGGLFNV